MSEPSAPSNAPQAREPNVEDSPWRDEFYVGYLPVPAGYRQFAKRIIPALLLAVLVVGVVVAARHRDPGTGVWDTDRVREFEGVVFASPYAMIRVADESVAGGVRTILLVQEGKFGAIARVRSLDGRPAVVRGFILERDGRELLELESSDKGVQASTGLGTEAAAQLSDRRMQPLGKVRVQGEIIDPKCYFGAMKPGEGKAHKECATLCIAGGIPPMFKTTDPAGKPVYYLLVDPEGRATNEAVLPFVADAVEVTGELERADDLQMLRISPGNIRRL